LKVSILTRPEGRVQLPSPSDAGSTMLCFNPHPSRRTGATCPGSLANDGYLKFQSSPVPKDGCNVSPLSPSANMRVSILTRPEGRVQRSKLPCCAGRRDVSILTRPEGRVQRAGRGEGGGKMIVSILTRPEGRVQPVVALHRGSQTTRFNPHPSRRTGATCGFFQRRRVAEVSILTRPEGRVQPSPRCPPHSRQAVSILTRPEGRVQPRGERWTAVGSWFQSSPVPKDGCNPVAYPPISYYRAGVSILTRPEGRVQRITGGQPSCAQRVSILTRPEGRVQQ